LIISTVLDITFVERMFKHDEIKKIILKVWQLLIDIIFFGYRIVQQITLPNRKKKGNLLSSAFTLFLGIIERIDNFEYGVFHMANLLRRKYIKQSLLIVATLLFLLSSLEWTSEKILNSTSPNYIEQLSDADVQKETVGEQRNIKKYSETFFSENSRPSFKNFFFSGTPFSSSIKTYLRFRSIRI
jgi:hypothetical protein